IVVLRHRTNARELYPWVLSVMLGILAFFLLVMTVPAPVFQRLAPVPADGRGLNPLLEDSGMITHPVALYLGFTGFTVPFAFAIAALVTGRVGDAWITTTRRWTITAWYFLSLGLLIGGWWSYHVLGWGGYWAWDPVENAAFMPWLTGTAFLHSVMIQERRRAVLQPGERAALSRTALSHGHRAAHRLASRVAGQSQAQLPLAHRRRHRSRRGLSTGRRALDDRRALTDAHRVRGIDDHRRPRARDARAVAHGRALARRARRAAAAPQSPLRRVRRAPGHPGRRHRRHGLASVVGADRDDTAPRRVDRARRLSRALRWAGRQRGIEPRQGHRHVHGGQRSRRAGRAAAGEEVLSTRTVADRLRGLSAGTA